MKKHSILGATLGCTVLSASLVACGVDTAPARSNPPMATIATSAETFAVTGASTYQLYHVHKTDPHALRAFELVSRAPDGKILHAMKVQMLQESATGVSSPVSHLPHLLLDSQGNVRENTLSAATLALQGRLGRDASQSTTEAYGCTGDIVWTIGGVIASIGTCAAVIPGAATGPIDAAVAAACVGTVIAGPIAGGISVAEDCFNNGVDEKVNYMFEDDDGTVEDIQNTDGGNPIPDWDYRCAPSIATRDDLSEPEHSVRTIHGSLFRPRTCPMQDGGNWDDGVWIISSTTRAGAAVGAALWRPGRQSISS